MNKISRQVDNASTILRYLAVHGATTQTQVVKDINLQRTSVFNIFETLENAGLIQQQSSVMAPHKGRPCFLWNLHSAVGGFMTVYVGNTETTMSYADFSGTVVDCVTERSPHDFDLALDRIVVQAGTWHQRMPLLGVIVVLSGRVDFDAGEVVISRLWGRQNYPLRQVLQKRLSGLNPELLVMIENNTRMAAWGQRFDGLCVGSDHYLALHIIDGRRDGSMVPISIGSGAVMGGHVYRGVRGGAGELDEACYRWFDHLYADGRFPIMISELDSESREHFAVKLGENFAHLVNYLAPQRMVVIFEQTAPSPDFFTCLCREVRKHLIYTDSDNFPVELALDGCGSVLRGASALLRDGFFMSGSSLIRLLESRLSVIE